MTTLFSAPPGNRGAGRARVSRAPSLLDRTSEQEERNAGYRVDQMMRPLRNVLTGLATAIVIAFVLAVPSIGRVSTWKIVLALLGLALFVVGGRHRSQPS
jgi:hypothetical protein